MTRRLSPAAAMPLASSGLAVVMAFLVGGLFLQLRGMDPVEAYRVLFSRGLGTSFGITETLIKMAPLLIIGGGLLIALKAGVWNIGLDGQFLVGALMVGVAAPQLAGEVPTVVMFLISAVLGFAGGLAWAIIPALLKVRYGLNEIITTLMMNYVAINFTAWMVKGPVKDPAAVPPQTALIPREFRLPRIPFIDVHIGLLVGLVVVALIAFLFRGTVFGFRLWALGQNRRAAIHAGMPVGRLTVLALLLSGGFAGLAGANDVLGVKGLFQGNWYPGYGFTAFALVFLARLNSFWIIPFAYLFSFLMLGGDMMSRAANIPTYYVGMLEGLMLVFFAVAVYLERTYAAPARRARRELRAAPRETAYLQPQAEESK